MNEFVKALIKSNQNFQDIVEPALTYTSESSGAIRIYTFLKVDLEANTVLSMFNQEIESLVKEIERHKEYKDIQIMSFEEYSIKEAEALKNQYKVGTPKQVSKARYWEMLEVLPPEKWERSEGADVFRLMEAISGDLHSFFFCIGENYFEMVNHRHADYSIMLQACRALPIIDIPDTEDCAA